MQPDGDEELLSPIPDLFAMQGIKTPSKGQHEHAPLFATIRSAATGAGHTETQAAMKKGAKAMPAAKARKSAGPAGGQRKASKRITLEQEGSDDDDENGLSLKAVAQQMTAALSPHNDADSDEEEGMAEVQLLLKRVMAHKKVTSRKKEMQILQGAAQHSAALERHQQRLRDIHAAFEAAVAAEWAEVQKTGTRQAAFLKDAQAAQRKRAAAHKRQLAEVEQRTAQIMAATEAKIKELRKKAGKMTSLARVLQPFAKAQTCSSPSV
ncbi:hypothetical protein WJX75_000793 [Coccomyxa subellipsoidea]|uniref:Uncharacterized protein n=1 Tax=Coccomyxa subellipsoidea TaxID=248742 RepID=A0ABR2YWK8_9CHLO